MQQMELCGRCVELLREKYMVRLVNRPINQKITCEVCGLRQYGGVYDVGPAKRSRNQGDPLKTDN